ncbi:hypothetical protein [Rhizobium rhizosphaerae]|uniref:hypothetical protein n=1 Tax=Xaviernesmea rhizosphaerae TaxID=1672749 RepID=UPI0015934374|nr:hypothetical protein [Xaviernesmea rhizosphaerae]
MNPTVCDPSSSTARQLRPIVMAVIAANIAVFSLLMTTINLPAPQIQPGEVVAADVE